MQEQFPYTVKIHGQHLHNRDVWVERNIGRLGKLWTYGVVFDAHLNKTYVYSFKTESDAVRFKLTWL